ncbi:MAG: DUF3332 family protein [Leptospira sp.]|jgi:hypothetical protein|nr:DUF3332 family protein [Leptospira sp.]
MPQINKFKKVITIFCIAVVGMFSTANCFGSFGIVKTVYSAHKGLRIGSGLLAKFIQTLLMYFPFSILYGIGFVADIILFNLVEFWTGSNPVAMSEFDRKGELVREFKNGNENVKLTYSDFGQKLKISVSTEGKSQDFFAFQDQEGKLFTQEGEEFQEIQVSAQEIGSSTILKLSQNGKLSSSKVIKSDDLKNLEKSYSANL